MDKKQNSLIANLEIDKLDILSGGFKPPIEDPLIDGALWNENGILKISGTIPIEPGVRIRYTSTEDLTTLDAFAIGGTAHISDNGDGTYDLWSDDACEFIALSDDYYDHYYMDITKIEVIKGNSLKYFYYYDASTFADFSTVTLIDVSNLDTSTATSMESMFGGCYSLTSIDVSNFDTSNVTNMRKMFDSSDLLTSINISSFDTSNVTNTEDMFNHCTSLECITNLDTTSATNKINMFKNCTALVQPDAAAQADLTDDDGANWVNPNACP